jgi:hypothetical protein
MFLEQRHHMVNACDIALNEDDILLNIGNIGHVILVLRHSPKIWIAVEANYGFGRPAFRLRLAL